MKTIGIIDIGSNSVRLLLVGINTENGSIKIIDELKDSVRLGEGLDKDSLISEEKIQTTIKTLQTFKSLCDTFKTDEIIAVATEAVRKATNQTYFLEKIQTEVNLNVTVLSGKEEAYYDYFGAINSINKESALIMDIGGASTELILVKDRKVVHSISFPFGAINLTQKFKIKNALTNEQESSLKNFLKENFKSVSWLENLECSTLIGIGGSIRNLSKIDRKYKNYPINTIHGYTAESNSFKLIFDLVKSKTLQQRKKIKGLSDERSDIIVGAACAVDCIIDLCKIKQVIVSGKGLREGLLYNYLCKDGKPMEDMVENSVMNILNTHDGNKTHSMHVYSLAKTLYDSLNTDYDLENISKVNVSNILKTAAILHDIGINITYYDHHKHSFYMIINSQINGLTHKELLISAYVAASHRHEIFKLNISQYRAIIDKYDILLIEKLGILLTLSESLDRSMTGVISEIKCELTKDEFTIKTFSNGNANLEIFDALKAAFDFKTIYERNLNIIQ